MDAADEPPIFAQLILELDAARRDAENQLELASRVLDDIEALHEPTTGGDCPTCGLPAPCPTFRLVHREIDLTSACEEVRGRDGGAVRIPSLEQLLNAPTSGIDRYFELLLR